VVVERHVSGVRGIGGVRGSWQAGLSLYKIGLRHLNAT
jgi:hypothetical protein